MPHQQDRIIEAIHGRKFKKSSEVTNDYTIDRHQIEKSFIFIVILVETYC